jgi:replicative DNA helicase
MMASKPVFSDNDAELSVLGASLIDNSCIESVSETLKPEDFYTKTHVLLWDIIVSLSSASKPVDLVTINDEVRNRGLEIAPGYIAGLTNGTVSSANVSFYVDIVKKHSMRRALYKGIHSSMVSLKDTTKDPTSIALELCKEGGDISTSTAQCDYVKMGSIISQSMAKMEQWVKNPDSLSGLPTGLKSIDELTSGYEPGDLVIIAARPGAGKTSMALTCADSLAVDQNIPTAIFSCEMSAVALNLREISMRSRISSRRMKQGHISSSMMGKIQTACGFIYSAPLYINDTSNIKLSAFKASARKLIYDKGVKIIFIDYLTLIDAEQPRLPRWEQVSYISRELKGFARDFKIPIVALSQLKREAEGKQPNLSDLRESSSIEQDADIIFFLHRPNPPELNAESVDMELICAKQRNGPVGLTKMNYLTTITKFEDVAEVRHD